MDTATTDESLAEEMDQTYGLGWRASFSIFVGVCWLGFLLLWFFFNTEAYNWEKHISVILLSLLLLCGLLGVPWLFWWQRHQTTEEKEICRQKGFKPRIIISGGTVVGMTLILIYWFWFIAEPFSWYQNIIVFIVVFLIAGGILGALWAPFGMKHKKIKP